MVSRIMDYISSGAPCAITLNYCTYTNHVLQGHCTVWWILAMDLADLLGIANCIAERSKVPNG